ncbi:tRNA pseudouridine(55) synthase TruB [Clostridium folliculivorans]|uniref:tRNA pseudouridine synthase B n=1 Tax=Clostridium folliculivorans TaxID=2886038 RepID=A0A9W5Y174_9CLOT|nr:tRNA pseudouridine(55) synthase TruB [Clostridium folliculivorans]GKU24748.1 tRNA pseudouridine synthase B [Clostridium folliculivorans]GKU30846.1 tRNA pseudouridine synthase B [Clostridium folliculivorans]
MNGIININKSTGMTSFDVVRKVRFLTKEKKVGHTGTLDPEASGVLPVCMGKATKIIDYIMENQKSYKVSFQLGIVTDTYDLEGSVIKTSKTDHIKNEDVLKVISKFIGLIDQVPPMYSALKVNGKRLYELARQGKEIEREARKINIYSIDNIDIALPYVTMDVTCSKGTYIRSLCFDIGNELNVGATMTALCRTRNGFFTLGNSVKLEDLNESNINDFIISIEDALKFYDSINVNEKFSKLLINGVRVSDRTMIRDELDFQKLYKVYDNKGSLIGLGKMNRDGFKLEKLLLD